MKLTVSLQKACVRVLTRCREFSDKHTLEPLFGIDPLTKYVNALPLEARSRVHLVEVVIYNLVTYAGTKGEPLVELLSVLRDKREEAEAEWRELDELYKQVSFYLTSLAGESDDQTGETRHKESERQELRDAIQLYTGTPKSKNDSETAANWLGPSYGNHEDWAFRIALVVFAGAPWDLCMEAALNLAKRLMPVAASTPDTPGKSTPLSGPASSPLKSLSDAGGELVTQGTYRAVKLKDQQLARGVLDYVWDEYTRRELLMEWLSELVVSRNSYNRIRGSIAAGFLMLNNFENIQRGLLTRWARADEPRSYRQAIGRALGVVAEEGSRLADVRNLLKLWASSSDQALRWAAARAYIYAGIRCPIEEVITQWKIIADAEEIESATINFGNIQLVLVNPLHVSLLDAMESFFLNAAGIPEVRRTAFVDGVKYFKRWADEEQHQDADPAEEDDDVNQATVGLGLLMLIKLARMNVPSEAEYSSWPPVLVTLIESGESEAPFRKRLVELFEQILLDPASQPTALDILRGWLNRVEKNPQLEVQMRSFLNDLLACVPLQGEIRRLIAMQLDLWSPSSRFRIQPEHPDLKRFERVVLVVDGSQSALRYWSEIRSLALELGSAFPGAVGPEVYLLNSGAAQTLAAFADTKLDLAKHEDAACSLIAPVIRDLVQQARQIDALVLIGNGEVFDLADWAGHPAIRNWVLVRLGPDPLALRMDQKTDEISTDLPAAVYERLLNPIQKQAQYSYQAKPTGVANDRWKIDRTGYPMVRVDSLQTYLHLFPVAKAQFERFIAGGTAPWGDEEYAELLNLNPRVSYRVSGHVNYEQLFLTGIRPEESKVFGSWLGDEYSLPDHQQWLTCYEWMAGQPITEVPQGISDDAFAIWQFIIALRAPRTLLELSLMSEGVKEWVRIGGKTDRYGGLGRPAPRFHTLSRDPRALVNVTTIETRQNAYGFRLLRR